MFKISFILRSDKINLDGYAPIRMVISIDGKRIKRVVPNVKVRPTDWFNKRIKPNLKGDPYNYHIEYNLILDSQESKVKDLYRHSLLADQSLEPQEILDVLDGRQTSLNNHDIFNAMDEFIASHRAIRAKGTINKYRACINFLKNFNSTKKYKLDFNKIDHKFLEAFRDYAYLERNTVNNYYGKLIAFVKTFMNWAYDRGYHRNLQFKKFKSISEDIEVIYLTMDELMKLYNFQFDSKRLSQVRDLYCFGCFTGLRLSDLISLKPSNVYKDHLKMTVQKTRSLDHKVPLNKMAINILAKYKGTLREPIPKISGQKLNKYIQECCELVGINRPTTITRYIGNRRIDKTLPKFKLITSHTARKTFVTNSLILGMNERVLKNITGHNDDASFRKYVKIAEDFKQNEMTKTWDKM